MGESIAAVPVSVMVFTLNEEINLPSCLASVTWCDDVIVVDSFSTDRTEEIARNAGARFFSHEFEGFGTQRMWALENCSPRHAWVLILDADERVTPELTAEMSLRLPNASDSLGAFRLKRRFHMWGRWLRYSNLYPSWVVRLVRNGRVTFVNRGHAETQLVEGTTGEMECDLIDENLKGMDAWLERQDRYAAKEAEAELAEESLMPDASLFSADPLLRRAAMKHLAARLPLRPQLYFLYTYLIRGGFLEGRDGLRFCAMKASYQAMIVAKKRALRLGQSA